MARGWAFCPAAAITYTALVLLLGAVSCVLAPAQAVVNEVLALNQGVALDGEGNPSDFVELHNPTARKAVLAGYYLTDDRAALTKWRFGAVSIEPGGYLVVWCSGKDRASGNAPHTSFKLGRKGGEVLLVAKDGRSIVSAMSYGCQRADVSQWMHAIEDRPVVSDGEIVIRPIMYVALTYDHRIVDGREAVTFPKTPKPQIYGKLIQIELLF